MVYDRSEGTLIKWNAQGKVAEVRKDQLGVSQTTKFWYNAAGNRVKKQVINHLAADPEESSVTYYVRDANEAVMAIYQQTVFHASGPPGCLRKSNNGGMDMDMDGVVDGGCDKCTNGVPPAGGSSWNPWQEDYDQDGLGDACDPCPFIFGSVCGPQQPGLPAMPEMWNGVATTTKLAELPIYGSERLGLMRPNVLRDTVIVINPTPSIFTRRVDQKEYELKDHLGNVRVVVSDMKKRVGDLTATFTLRVKSVNAYYAFGMLEEGMSGSSEGYRYGYNGMEMDNEIKGVGNSYTTEFRQLDSRLGRWLSIDPVTNPSESPYASMSNKPIVFTDIKGNTVTGDVKAVEDLTKKTKENIERIDKEVQEIDKTPAQEQSMEARAKKASLSNRRQEYVNTIKEIQELQEASVVFHVQIVHPEIVGNFSGDNDGTLFYNWDQQSVVIQVSNTQNRLQSLVHEIKHAYQYLLGKISLVPSFNPFRGKGGSLTDITDEIEAYNRMEFFSDNQTTVTVYTEKEVRKKGYENTPSPYMDMQSVDEFGNVWLNQNANFLYNQKLNDKIPHEVFIGWEKYYNAKDVPFNFDGSINPDSGIKE